MNARIAIVEDEPDIRRILADFLTKNGCTVSEAADGLDASKLLAEEQFDLILMDLMLPNISGERLIAELRTSSSYRRAQCSKRGWRCSVSALTTTY